MWRYGKNSGQQNVFSLNQPEPQTMSAVCPVLTFTVAGQQKGGLCITQKMFKTINKSPYPNRKMPSVRVNGMDGNIFALRFG